MMTEKIDSLLDRFERLEIPAPDFHHADHVRVAFDMLDQYEFVEACARYAATIRTMAESVGAPDKFNATITIAFLSLIAERKEDSDATDREAFLASNPDLLHGNALGAWYSPERLTSPTARRQFLLPDRLLA